MSPIKVLIADDHIIIREGLLNMLSRSSAIEVVGEARNGTEAVAQARELMPDVVLMDLRMPGLDGVTATQQIVAESPHVKVLVLTVSDDSKDLVEAVKAGARGYLLKDASEKTLVGAVEAIHGGESIINPAMAADLFEEFRSLSKERERQRSPLVAKLTDREHEILKLLAEGLENRGIAQKIFVSESTVKNHVSNILSKLQLGNRIQAAVFAEREGLTRHEKP